MSRVLILNTGSSSLKWAVLDSDNARTIAEGDASWGKGDPEQHAGEIANALGKAPPFDAAGHRVVHGGAVFTEAVRVDDHVRAEIERLAELAPLHNPAALAGIAAVTQRFPDVPQVAAFDTSFHATLPEEARRYALPWQWQEQWGLRRFGFHGLSVSYATRRAGEMRGAVPGRLVVCHLGAGCSVTAVAGGHSVETSMGFTPLEGLVMATRSGSVDPGLLMYLLQHKGITPAVLDHALNEESGFAAVSGAGKDFRDLLKAADAGDERATLAYVLFVRSIVRTVGGMIAVLGGLDALIFTGGIGQHSPRLRRDVVATLTFAGVHLENAANEAAHGATDDADVSDAAATARTLVIAAREDLAVLAETKRVLSL